MIKIVLNIKFMKFLIIIIAFNLKRY